jgi:hypothetical protein
MDFSDPSRGIFEGCSLLFIPSESLQYYRDNLVNELEIKMGINVMTIVLSFLCSPIIRLKYL